MEANSTISGGDLEPAGDAAVLEEMTRAGVLYGRKKTKTHPKMKPFILTTRNGVEIFDLSKTLELTERAKDFLKSVRDQKGKILLVGVQPGIEKLIKSWADKLDCPFVTGRWLGGTLTNFSVMSRQLGYFLKLKADRTAGKLEKYTKKERLNFDREIARMEKLFSGLEKLDKLPQALFIVDTALKNHQTAVREANRLRIPIAAVLNSDNNPDQVQYPIPGNCARASVEWIMNRLFT
jgi:small subunit ribosomal protein S2